MSQIKPTQIIPGKEVRINPASSLPVDLNPAQRNFMLERTPIVTDPESDGQIDQNNGDLDLSMRTATLSQESVLETADAVPTTPAIISVKEQVIRFMPDGTAKIDVILEVQDIENAVEYDIRMAKDAGNL